MLQTLEIEHKPQAALVWLSRSDVRNAVDAMADYLDDGTKPKDVIEFPPLMITKDTAGDVPPEELGK